MISTSFADIFKQNSLKNSLLPIVVPADVHAALFALVDRDRTPRSPSTWPPRPSPCRTAAQWSFPSTRSRRHCLLEGVDELGYILKNEAAIAAFEAGRVGSIDTLG